MNAQIIYPNMNEVCKVTDCSVIKRELTIKEKVQVAFADVPMMMQVVQGESGFRQFNKKGKPLMSTTSDVGVMQLNIVHWKEARKLGLDIFNNVDDNIKMGRIVFERQGLKAWMFYKYKLSKRLST